MQITDKMVTLEGLGNGAAKELFEAELRRVVENVSDPNTPWKAKRAITLKITISPEGDERTAVGVAISCTSKVAAPTPYPTRLFVGIGADGPVAVESNPEQPRLDFEVALQEDAAAKTSPLKEVK